MLDLFRRRRGIAGVLARDGWQGRKIQEKNTVEEVYTEIYPTVRGYRYKLGRELVSPLGTDSREERRKPSYPPISSSVSCASIIQRSTTPEPSSEIRRGIANAYVFLRNSSFGLASPPPLPLPRAAFHDPRRSNTDRDPRFHCVSFQPRAPWEAGLFSLHEGKNGPSSRARIAGDNYSLGIIEAERNQIEGNR